MVDYKMKKKILSLYETLNYFVLLIGGGLHLMDGAH